MPYTQNDHAILLVFVCKWSPLNTSTPFYLSRQNLATLKALID